MNKEKEILQVYGEGVPKFDMSKYSSEMHRRSLLPVEIEIAESVDMSSNDNVTLTNTVIRELSNPKTEQEKKNNTEKTDLDVFVIKLASLTASPFERTWKEKLYAQADRQKRILEAFSTPTQRLINELHADSIIQSLNSQNETIEIKFKKLAEQWRKETVGIVSPFQKHANKNYLHIIKLGEKVIPYILRALQKKPDDWFLALEILLPEGEQNPVTKDDSSSFKRTTEAWLNWGKKKGYLS